MDYQISFGFTVLIITAEICFRTNLFAVYKCKLLGVVDQMRKRFPNDTFKRIPWERIEQQYGKGSHQGIPPINFRRLLI